MKTIRRSKQIFVGAALVSLVASVSLWFSGLRDEGLFVGLWVPSILALGALVHAGRGRS